MQNKEKKFYVVVLFYGVTCKLYGSYIYPYLYPELKLPPKNAATSTSIADSFSLHSSWHAWLPLVPRAQNRGCDQDLLLLGL